MARRGFRGMARVLRVMRKLPDAFSAQIVSVLDSGGRLILSAMRARAPKRTGALREGLSYRVYPKTLRMRAGLLDTRRGADKLFYGRIQDKGRKAQVVTVRRYVRKRGMAASEMGGRIIGPYQMRVRAMPGKRFVTGQFTVLRRAIGNAVRGIWGRAMASAEGAAAND